MNIDGVKMKKLEEVKETEICLDDDDDNNNNKKKKEEREREKEKIV